MTDLQPYHWTKSHGLGNDYLVIVPGDLPPGLALTPATVRLICDRHYGVGSDGILELIPPREPRRFGLRIWNPDGSLAEKSGNGLRIFARFLYDHRYARDTTFVVATSGGDAAISLEVAAGGGRGVTVDIGVATFSSRETLALDGEKLAVSILSVGNPHCVVVVPDLDRVALSALGPKIERHPAFPARTNVQFAQPLDRQTVRALIWERGAGETLASGSSACAVAAACHRLGLVDNMVRVLMPGGDLAVEIGHDGRLLLTGPVEEVAQGCFSDGLLARLRRASERAEL